MPQIKMNLFSILKKNTYIIKEKDIFIIIGNKESIQQFKIDLLSNKPQRVLDEK